jgi:hypothetical protein
MAIHRGFRFILGQLPFERPLMLPYSLQNHVRGETSDQRRKVAKSGSPVKVLGKLCPCCGVAGSVLCETDRRLIYECWNGHQYETKKRSGRGANQ